MDPVLTTIIAVLGFATGTLVSHATLGKDVREALVEIKNLTQRMDRFDALPPGAHFHRRATDEA